MGRYCTSLSPALRAAVVNKLIKEMVPNIRVSNDARDLLLNCCSGLRSLLGLSLHGGL